MKLPRRTLRKHAFSMIFQLEFHDNINIEEYFDMYIASLSLKTNQSGKDFVVQLFNQTKNNLPEIDETISRNLKNWTLKRLNKADLALLRLAVCEILTEKTPKRIIINEILELAKEFSSEEAPAFINGILAGVGENI